MSAAKPEPGSTDGLLGWIDRRYQIRASAIRDGFRYSPVLATAGQTFTDYTVGVTSLVRKHWRLHGSAGYGTISDGNNRQNLTGIATYVFDLEPLNLETGYMIRYMNYDEQVLGGYFDPSNFWAHMALVSGNGEWGRRNYSYSFSAGVGLQSFDFLDTHVSNDRVFQVSGAIGIPVGRGFKLEPFATWGDYAAQNPAGFESLTVGLRLHWRPER